MTSPALSVDVVTLQPLDRGRPGRETAGPGTPGAPWASRDRITPKDADLTVAAPPLSTASAGVRALFSGLQTGLALLGEQAFGAVVRKWHPAPPVAAVRRQPLPAAAGSACLFCRREDLSANRVLCENETFFARYDNFPATAGHVEVVPKRHVESFFDLEDYEVVDAYSLLKDAKKLLDREHGPDGYTIGVNEGLAAGRSVHHLHIHLVPRRTGDVADPRGGIRRALPNGDPDLWVVGPSQSASVG